MNRRVITIVVGVVTFLAIAPHLPQWLPALGAAVRDIDLSRVRTALAPASEWWMSLEWWEQLLAPTVAAGVLILLVVAIGSMRRRRSRSDSRPSHVAAVRSATTTVIPSPVVERPSIASTADRDSRFQRPAVAAPTPEPLVAFERPAISTSRLVTVKRLHASGRSVAEISRATGIGQDAVRALWNVK